MSKECTEDVVIRLMEEMTHAQVGEAVEQGAVVLLPVGSTEQHGHMPLGTDNMVPAYVTEKVAVDLNANGVPVIIAPPLSYGAADHHTAFPGTVSLGWGLFVAVVERMLREFYRTGFRKVVILNGHGGNHQPLTNAIQGATAFSKGLKVHNMLVPYLLCSPDFTKNFPGQEPRDSNRLMDDLTARVGEKEFSHADANEASLLFGSRPDLFAQTKDELGDAPRIPDMTTVSGVRDPLEWKERMAAGAGGKGDPRYADPELGRQALDFVALQISGDVQRL